VAKGKKAKSRKAGPPSVTVSSNFSGARGGTFKGTALERRVAEEEAIRKAIDSLGADLGKYREPPPPPERI
jgi:hypothetical protein